MPCAQLTGHCYILHQGQNAGRRDDFVVAYYHSAVMQRSVGLEYVLYKRGGNASLYKRAGIYYIAQAGTLLYNYQRAYPALGKVGYSLMHFTHGILGAVVYYAAEKLAREQIAAANMLQCTAKLRLEQYHSQYNAHRKQ